MSVVTHWCLRVPTGASGCLLLPESAFGCLRVHTGF